MAQRNHSQTPGSPERPTTPTRGAMADILNFTQQITPRKTPRRYAQLRADIQARANDADEDHRALIRRIADLENQASLFQRPQKRCRRNNCAADADENIENLTTLERRCRAAGCHFALEESLFLVDPQRIWTVNKDDSFDSDNEFEDEDTRIQGQLRDVLGMLPSDAQPLRKNPMIGGSFMDGMDGERGTMSTRLRVQALANIVANVKPFATSAGRKEAFADLIGYSENTDTGDWYYKPLTAEILYDVYDGTCNLDHIFRNSLLLKLSSHPFNLPGAVGLLEGRSRMPQAKCVERMYRIKRTSPGMIANAAVLAIWLHSADVELVQIGNQTEINYTKRYEIYLARICRGLHMRKRWARDLFTYWDSILFPHAEDSLGENLSTNQQAEQDELNEAMDIFDDAPSVPSVLSASRPLRRSRLDAAGFEPRTLPHPTADKRAAAVSNAAIANATNAKR
ncbi:hypothetical protein FB451DRAFT_1387808 [Mycena latifolia]|nr:hypothetical protein FB451DRAFT_1387808 [Mycena latifolia]